MKGKTKYIYIVVQKYIIATFKKISFIYFFSKVLSIQQEVASAFIKNFQLTSSELTVLHGSARESPITEEFFTVINKVQVMH